MSNLDNVAKVISTPLTLEECENLSTSRLLVYFRKYRNRRSCYDTPNEDDQIIHKDINDYLDDVRYILNQREHVE